MSNYILQKFVCTALFYSYGFGLYGKVSPLAGLAITSLIFSVELFISTGWIQRCYFGPLEWIWRSITYRRVQSLMRIQPVK